MAKKDDTEILRKKFSVNLQNILNEKGMRQVDLRNAIITKFGIDVGKENISNWYHGKYLPMGDNMIYLCQTLGTDEAILLGERKFAISNEALAHKVEACDIIEQCFGIQAKEVVRKLLNLNDAGILAANKYIDFLVEQPEYTLKGEGSSEKKAI